MASVDILPEISTTTHSPYLDTIRYLLRKIFPEMREGAQNLSPEGFVEKLDREIPIVKTSEFLEPPFHLSIFLLCPSQGNAAKFFYDMIQRWLMPGKRFKIELFFASDFRFITLSHTIYSIVEIVIPVKNSDELALIRRNFPLLAREISLGVGSAYQAARIMEMKGLSVDQKTGMIQERLAAMISKMPNHFDTDLFVQMQKCLVSTTEVFKGVRSYSHLLRIIYLTYLLQKRIKELKEHNPQQHHAQVKVISVTLQLPFGVKPALGVFVSLNLLRESEVFQKHHFMRALLQCDENLIINEDSFLVFEKREDERIITAYIEVEKSGEEPFSLKERQALQGEIPTLVRANIERLLRPVFMPRNEEEVMRNIVILSGQLKLVRDLPQVIISFEEQDEDKLTFTIIVVRLLRDGVLSSEELFERSALFKVERVRKVGRLRNKSKEALVLRATLNNIPFLRQDLSLNLYRARQHLLSELQQIIGEVRDYNGGMISKQNELFLSLQESLGEMDGSTRLLLENFFHSIFPVELRSILRTEPLKILFLMLKGLLGRTEKLFQKREEASFALIGSMNAQEIERILEAMSKIPIGRLQLARLQFQHFEITYLGFILFSGEADKVEAFERAMELGS